MGLWASGIIMVHTGLGMEINNLVTIIYTDTDGKRLDALLPMEIGKANQLERQMNHESSKG